MGTLLTCWCMVREAILKRIWCCCKAKGALWVLFHPAYAACSLLWLDQQGAPLDTLCLLVMLCIGFCHSRRAFCMSRDPKLPNCTGERSIPAVPERACCSSKSRCASNLKLRYAVGLKSCSCSAQGHVKDSRVSVPVLAFVPLAISHKYRIWSFRRGTSVQSDPSSLAP